MQSLCVPRTERRNNKRQGKGRLAVLAVLGDGMEGGWGGGRG
jgi:hypothetical protein